jgi:DNA-binding transcriptional LysR family regulator
MQNTIFSWDGLRVLLAVHQRRSFLAAGRALGLSTSTVARQIDALEAALGRRLVARTSAGAVLEPEALPLAALAAELAHGVAALERDRAGAPSPLAGTVRLSVGEGFARPVTELLAGLRRRHPELELELVVEARLSDLGRREADVGLRTARSSSSTLLQRAVGRLRFGLFASRAYVQSRLRGSRLRASELAQHEFVGFDGPLARLPQQQWLVAHGARRFVFRTNSDTAQREAAERGMGLCVLAERVGQKSVELVQLDLDEAPPSLPLFIVLRQELRGVPRIRAVVAALDAELRRQLL